LGRKRITRRGGRAEVIAYGGAWGWLEPETNEAMTNAR